MKRTYFTLILSLSFLILFTGCGEKTAVIYQPVDTSGNASTETAAIEEAEVPTSSKEPAVVMKNIGDEITIGPLTFKINSVTEQKTISSKYSSPVSAKNKAKFIVLNMSLINEGVSNATFFPNNFFRLMDDEKKRDYTTYNQTIGNIDEYLEMRDLGPGIEETGFLVYEIPETITRYGFFAYDESMGKLTYYIILNNE